jgi:RimJ/RimL family protein N-acetyltransferase
MTQRATIIETPRLLLGTWLPADRDLFREINADPKVMEFFPFRRSYEEADAVLGRLNGMLTEDGLGFYSIVLKQSAEPMGFCGLSHPNLPGIFPDQTVEVGWRLATRFWGNGYATEAAKALLDHAFAAKGLDAVVSFAVEANRRSTGVMQRLGLHRIKELDFNHPRVPETHPHLRRHIVYAVTRKEWSPQEDSQARRPD